jgi:hypothetical protein
MRGDELIERLTVALFAPAFGKRVFLLPFDQGKPVDGAEIAANRPLKKDRRSVCQLRRAWFFAGGRRKA